MLLAGTLADVQYQLSPVFPGWYAPPVPNWEWWQQKKIDTLNYTAPNSGGVLGWRPGTGKTFYRCADGSYSEDEGCQRTFTKTYAPPETPAETAKIIVAQSSQSTQPTSYVPGVQYPVENSSSIKAPTGSAPSIVATGSSGGEIDTSAPARAPSNTPPQTEKKSGIKILLLLGAALAVLGG